MESAIYISGAITGTTDYRERFAKAEKLLKEQYDLIEVINPVKKAKLVEINTQHFVNRDPTWLEYMRASLIQLLMYCDMIYMLKGWESSRGAVIEHNLAKDLGLRIAYEEVLP